MSGRCSHDPGPPADAGRELAGQWAVVTGGSKGIGLGIAAALLDGGANVVLAARDPGALEAARADLASGRDRDQQVLARVADISDPESVSSLFTWVEGELPALNALVANAGSGVVTPFLELDADTWDRTIALNLTGTFHCIQQAARLMAARPQSANRSIVAVSSVRALGARTGLASYAASKAGLNQLVRVAAYELAVHGIRVNALSPGITLTPLLERSLIDNPDLLADRVADIPVGRPATTADVARAARFLCGPAAEFMTGANMVIDGGESLY